MEVDMTIIGRLGTMKFVAAHVKVMHNVTCNLHINRAAVGKQERILAYLKDARMVASTEWNEGLKAAVLAIMDAQISLGDCTSDLCRYRKVAGKVRLAA